MGIPKLYAQIRQHGVITTFPDDLTNSTTSTSTTTTPAHLIIDGPALAHHIWRRIHNPEGILPRFARAIEEYVAKLTGVGFGITVVFDGSLPMHKRGIRLARSTNSLKYLPSNGVIAGNSDALSPPFAVPVLQDVLLELGVEMFTAPSEADRECAIRVRRGGKGFYCLSLDSDMLVYDIADAGYIPLDTVVFTEGKIVASVFNPTEVSAKLGLRRVGDMVELAALLGAEGADEDVLMNAAHRSISACLKLILAGDVANTVGTGERDRVRALFDIATAAAQAPEADDSPLVAYVKSGRMYNRVAEVVFVDPEMEAAVVREIWLPVIHEDLGRASAWVAGRSMRAAAYGLLQTGGTVREQIRKGARIVEEDVPCVVVGAKDWKDLLSSSGEDLSKRVFVTAAREVCAIQTEASVLLDFELAALVLVFLISSLPSTQIGDIHPDLKYSPSNPISSNLRTIHIGAQYQAALFSTYALLQASQTPSLPPIWKFWDASLFPRLLSKLKGGTRVSALLPGRLEDVKGLYDDILMGDGVKVEDAIDVWSEKAKGGKGVSEVRSPKKKKVKKIKKDADGAGAGTPSKPIAVGSGNIYDMLMKGCTF